MAVPKKRVSKSRRDARKNTWKKKVLKNFAIAVGLAKSYQAMGNCGNFFIG